MEQRQYPRHLDGYGQSYLESFRFSQEVVTIAAAAVSLPVLIASTTVTVISILVYAIAPAVIRSAALTLTPALTPLPSSADTAVRSLSLDSRDLAHMLRTSRAYASVTLPAGWYAIRMTGHGGDFVLEAKVEMAATFAKSDARWHAPRVGDEYSVEIVHTDPDGGDYGGHLMIYGNGDDDATWTPMRLGGPIKPVERKKE